MPQLQLPIFPAGVTETNSQIAVEKKAGTVYYLYGHLPVLHHGEDDVHGFRMFTSQMIVNGTVKPREIVQAFGVPMVTVKRYVKVLRERGAAAMGALGSAPIQFQSTCDVTGGGVLLASRCWRWGYCVTRRRCMRCRRDFMASIASSCCWG